LHIARPAVQLYELALATKSGMVRGRVRTADGFPLPHAWLRARAGPRHADAAYFLRSGQRHAELVQALLEGDDSSIDDVDALLDFGCGCGRVARHWSRLAPQTRVFGCDIDPRMIKWCTANLRFVDATVNDSSPPLPYESSKFDLVYVFSVFTHLSEDLQHAWMREYFRVLKPDGYLLFSTLGEHYLSLKRLTESERQSFLDGHLVVLYEASSGTSLCSAYHPPQYVREILARDFRFISLLPAADDGRHDVYLFRKPTASPADNRPGRDT
jgi:SAM-dependent methyltransferase